jgi:hypothetical protein
MRRFISFFPFFFLLFVACSRIISPTATYIPSTYPAFPTNTIPIYTETVGPTKPPTPAPSPSLPNSNPITPPIQWLEQPPVEKRSSFEVRFHPDGQLYVGDQVSIEVLPPDGFDVKNHKVAVSLGEAAGLVLGDAAFTSFGLGGRIQATLLWVWDTSAQQAGVHVLRFTLMPEGASWIEMVTLRPRGQIPAFEQGARWAQAESECCLVHFITGTAAERDLSKLLLMLDEQAQDASQRLGVSLPKPVDVTLLPRVMGQGGFADGGVTISYLDRNYAGGETAIIFHHELVHLLDASLGGELRPPFLVEGFAVYESGGHFKPEPLLPRAAALLPPSPGCTPVGGLAQLTSFTDSIKEPDDSLNSAPSAQSSQPCGLGLYIPLTDLVEDFYTQQHEIGYLESAALIEYMVDRWGWKAFSSFYRDIHPVERIAESGSQHGNSSPIKESVEVALQRHFGLSIVQLEDQFLQALAVLQVSPKWVEDVRLDLIYHDRVRAYQQDFDPSAYFLFAWLPDGEQLRERGIVADYLRGPTSQENYALETLLGAADADLRKARYSRMEDLLQATSLVLEAYPERGVNSFRSNELAQDYYDLVQAALSEGHQPQQIIVTGDFAMVWTNKLNSLVSLSAYVKLNENWLSVTASSSR